MAEPHSASPRKLQPGILFAIIFGWKLVLLLIAALPVPANDSFFYDGAVVNWLLHGRYVNPSISVTHLISGTQVFSAYPPLYQAVLLPWMAVAGTSALSAMVLHLALFGAYAWLLLAVLRRLAVPAWGINVAGLFLLGITFHDRPDSLAHVWGMLAVFAWIRSRASLPAETPGGSSTRWLWLMTAAAVLCVATSLQIGATYYLLLWTGFGLAWRTQRARLPLVPMAMMVAVPALLVGLVALGFPYLWRGFLENVHLTPSYTGWRMPQDGDVLKLVRTVPGVLAVVALLGHFAARRPGWSAVASAPGIVCLAGTLAAAAVMFSSLTVLTPNLVMVANSLQPLLVGCLLAMLAARSAEAARPRGWIALFLLLAALVAIRAVGMTTWGLACAADMGYGKSIARVEHELATSKPGDTVLLSAAYLYQAARHDDIRWIHSDYSGKTEFGGEFQDLDGLLRLRPAKLILTPFDYYRRYAAELRELQHRPEVAALRIELTAKIPPPDSIGPLQRVVQHLSWAPVIIDITWKPR